MKIKKIVNFIFEINQLKKRKISGWYLANVDSPLSVAEHSLRAAQIGYILAKMEGADANKVTTMLVIHDNAEARTGDQNKVSARYFSKKNAEKTAFKEQIKDLGSDLEEQWLKYFEEFEKRNTKEGIIAQDADWLETAFQAKEYVDLGYTSAQNWIDNVEKALKTDSAKKLLAEMQQTASTDWWQNLKKITY